MDLKNLSRNEILDLNGISHSLINNKKERKLTKGKVEITIPYNRVLSKTKMISIFGEMVYMDTWN